MSWRPDSCRVMESWGCYRGGPSSSGTAKPGGPSFADCSRVSDMTFILFLRATVSLEYFPIMMFGQ
jgi:hypothetical protein